MFFGPDITPFTVAELSPASAKTLDDGLKRVQEAIAEHGTPVTLVAVTKYASLPQMVLAYEAGIRHFGENKVQDALAKKNALPPEISQGVTWHLMGHLQGNKVPKTVNQFSLIHSVDSLRLAEKLSRANQDAHRVQAILLQVNISGEPTKDGFSPDVLQTDMPGLKMLEGIQIQGLMTIAPNSLDMERVTRVFSDLRRLRDELEDAFRIQLPELSMGMSGDYGPALTSGATILRIGSQFFGSPFSVTKTAGKLTL